MPKVVENRPLSDMIWKMKVEVPRLVAKARAGQFVIIRVNDPGERVPMSIAGLDPENGLLTIVYQVVGKTSALMTTIEAGGEISDCVGPLGLPSHVEKPGKKPGTKSMPLSDHAPRTCSSTRMNTGRLPTNCMSVLMTVPMVTTVSFLMY